MAESALRNGRPPYPTAGLEPRTGEEERPRAEHNTRRERLIPLVEA